MREITDADRAIGQRIRAARLSQKVAAKALSSQLNVTIQQMQKYENGINRISASRLLIVSEFLGVSVTELLGLDGSLPNATGFSPQTFTLATAFERLPESIVKKHIYALVTSLAKE